jgi:hypothetical protein
MLVPQLTLRATRVTPLRGYEQRSVGAQGE